MDVVTESLERRDVEDPGLRQRSATARRVGQTQADELVDPPEEGGQRLAGTGRRRDQVAA